VFSLERSVPRSGSYVSLSVKVKDPSFRLIAAGASLLDEAFFNHLKQLL